MLSTKARPITRHEYALIPGGAPNQQLIEGDLVKAPFHQDIVGRFYRILADYLDEHRTGRVFAAPLDVHLSEINVYQPDLLFIRRENAGLIEEHGIEGAPDLVVEILSKSSEKYALGPKRAIYARAGVEELWIADPARKTLELFRLADDADTPTATYKAKQKFSSSLFPGLTINLAPVFAS